MSNDSLKDFIIEERVLPCPNPRCSNLLKIRVYLNEEDKPEEPFHRKGDVRYIEALYGNFGATATGCCLGVRHPPRGPGGGRWVYLQPTFRQGPCRRMSISMITCRRCFRRVGWKRFQKVNV